jgi:hypothetical protein
MHSQTHLISQMLPPADVDSAVYMSAHIHTFFLNIMLKCFVSAPAYVLCSPTP